MKPPCVSGLPCVCWERDADDTADVPSDSTVAGVASIIGCITRTAKKHDVEIALDD